MKSLTKNSLFNAFYQVLNMVFPLISSAYVARILLPYGVGRVAYAQNIAAYFVTAAALGIPTVGLRAISKSRDNQEKKDKVFSELIILNAISTTVSLVLYVVLIFSNPTFRADIGLYFATGVVIILNYINVDWLYQGHEEYVYIVVRNIITKVLFYGALFVFVNTKKDYVVYAVISSLATGGNYVFNIIRARKYISFTLKDLDLKQHFKSVFLIACSLFLGSIYSQLDITMLGAMVGEESVGFYSYAHKILKMGVNFCTAVTIAFLPRLSYYFENDRNEFYSLVKKGTQIVSFLAIPAIVGLFIMAPEAICLLFGNEFLPAVQTLRIFSILIAVFSFGNLMCYQMMLCSGNEKKHVIVLSAAATLNVILNAILIPKIKQDGAAIASVCTELFINLLEGIYFYRLLKLEFDWRSLGQAIFSALVMGLSIMALKMIMPASIVEFVCCVVIGVCLYVGMNVVLKNQFTLNAIDSIKRKIRIKAN